MPAAAVIPAPIVYIKVVAVKKLVVGAWRAGGGRRFASLPRRRVIFSAESPGVLFTECPGSRPPGLL